MNVEDGEAQVVCVLGMHRAGTSVTARVLNLLGMFVGEDEALVNPNPNNPKGTFEHRELMLVNQEVLQVVGGIWKEPPSLPAGWERDPALDPARERARNAIESTFRGVRLWGWKDPRTCLLLPFWQTVVPHMRYVICIRNPLDVAQSLARRNDLPAILSFELWLRYVADSLIDTAGGPRLVVFYEDYFVDWQEPVARLARFIGRPEEAARPELRELVEDWLESNLWHHRNELADAIGHPDLPLEARSLYLLLHLAFRHEAVGGRRAAERAARTSGESAADEPPAASGGEPSRASGADEALTAYARSLAVSRHRDAA